MASRAVVRCVGLYTSSLLTCTTTRSDGVERAKCRDRMHRHDARQRQTAVWGWTVPSRLSCWSLPCRAQQCPGPACRRVRSTHQVHGIGGHALGEDLCPGMRLDLRELELQAG